MASARRPAYGRGMQVSFTKVEDSRYRVTIERDHGPALVPRFAPGYDDLMPHDIAHYLVEECFEIKLGVWGQLAAGGGGIFSPAPEDNTLRNQRRVQRVGAVGREDMERSEQLVAITVAAWERTIGRMKHARREQPIQVDPIALDAAVRRIGRVAPRWHALQSGGSLTFVWPRWLTFDAATSRRGRRAAKPTPRRGRC
jgi:hypothetical protein